MNNKEEIIVNELQTKLSSLESEMCYLNKILIDCGFENGIQTLRATAEEVLTSTGLLGQFQTNIVKIGKVGAFKQNPTLPMAKLICEDTQEEFLLEDGAELQEACEQAGVPFACTEGVCGTCVIEVVEGMDNLSEFNQAEADFLGDLGSERLACQCKIKGGCVKIKI